MKINCIIVDDEQLARVLIEDFVSKVGFLNFVGSFKNPLDALAHMKKEVVDLVFLDIQMPDLTGIDLVKSMSKAPQIIFTTAYPEYALDGFELNVTDYLLKPFSFNRFLQAVNKVADLHQRLSPKGTVTVPDQQITIHADHKIYKILLKDILYIEGLKEYVSYYTKNGQRIIALQSLKSLEMSLGNAGFIRVHRSYIVPIGKIETLEGNQLRIGEKLIPVGRSYKDQLLKRVFQS